MAVGRFQVMATLQAARAYVTGRSEQSAKSFGLNRAIFYAAAKKGFKVIKGAKAPREIKISKKTVDPETLRKIQESFKVDYIGDEMAYSVNMGGDTYYVIGNEIQTSEDFQRQIERRFGDKFEDAWKEAIKICRECNEGVLLSQRYFYETVYKPRRDELAKKWSEL